MNKLELFNLKKRRLNRRYDSYLTGRKKCVLSIFQTIKLEVMDNSWQIFGSTISRDFVLKIKKKGRKLDVEW